MKLFSKKFKLLLLSLILLFSNSLIAQRPTQSFQKLIITGTVLDLETQEPLEYATITFKNERRPKLLQGGITNQEGKFSIEVFPGRYNISTEYISFKTITQNNVMTNFS